MSQRILAWSLAAGAAVGGTHWAARQWMESLDGGNAGAARKHAHVGRRAEPAPNVPAARMPPTDSAGLRPLAEGDRWALDAHGRNERLFLSATGFGYSRVYDELDSSGRFWASLAIRRAELVSLLLHREPSAYVLEQMPSAPTSDVAPRRPLDAFETAALAALRDGAEAVASAADPTRFVGAIRARADCVACHAGCREGDVLGAFTYYLAKPLGAAAPAEVAAAR